MAKSAPHGKGLGHAISCNAICCDVLDACFDPSPRAIAAFATTGLAMRTSPDTDARPLIEAIAEARHLDPQCISLGAGSSEIIHRVLPSLLGAGPGVTLDPTYSEYPYLIMRDGATLKAQVLTPQHQFQVDIGTLVELARGASLVALVNPNNPTGQALTRDQILDLRASLEPKTALWIDEAYVDYCPPGTSVEVDACTTKGLYVLKSLSKAYALSGIRAAYLVCEPSAASDLVSRTPPWIIGTSAQAAATAAVKDVDYYNAWWRETSSQVADFALALKGIGLTVFPGYLNAVLVEVPTGRKPSVWLESLAKAGLLVRTPEGMGATLGDQFVRIGLVDKELMPKVLEILGASL